MQLTFEQVGRIPATGDNVAIAIRRLEAGARIQYGNVELILSHTVLEGHRFAIEPIVCGQPLLSWNLPFGHATCDINPGDYVCNASILEALRYRRIDFTLPARPNFRDYLQPYVLNEAEFRPGIQVPCYPTHRCFEGYLREKRGVGTRNFIILLGTSSRTGVFVRALADRFRDVPRAFPNIDGVVAVAHTEGGGGSRPNNMEMVLRALAGFCVHPNVAAVLAVDLGFEPVTNALLRQFLTEQNYPIGSLPHHFLSVRGHQEAAMAQAGQIVQSWLAGANAQKRAPYSVEHLKVALQCGGSDAFSGISGNPLAGWVAKEVIRYGGAANLAETDELIGAEPYVLRNVRDVETARAFLKALERFQERASWHGHSAEGNPSGGNKYRGLYNIAIKSIGAARKKDPEVRLDYVIEYGERMEAPGFYFMDSPGNDLESIAGQVASGCNLLLFTTGNGSITNFPFVPTIKIMTNTGRFRLLSREMDVNAGRYQDGTPMEALGAETFELALKIASGERSVGERAGHSQVQIWRDWRQTGPSHIERVGSGSQRPAGEPLPLTSAVGREASSVATHLRGARFTVLQSSGRCSSDQVGLIAPTSLCSGQIAQMIARQLHREIASPNWRFVALAHTEGCGNSGGDSERLYMRTMTGYLLHPFVRKGLLLEHGCERTHNDAMRAFLAEHGLDETRFGWASIQLDGGIEAVTRKVRDWFRCGIENEPPAVLREAGLEAARLGLFSVGEVPEHSGAALAVVARAIVESGGTVVIPQNATVLSAATFVSALLGDRPPQATLEYGQAFTKRGLHIMDAPTDHAVETLTGLGATGVEVMIAHVMDAPLPSNPMVPLIQATSSAEAAAAWQSEIDLLISANATPATLAGEILRSAVRVLSRESRPKQFACGQVDFQMTRGLWGVSL